MKIHPYKTAKGAYTDYARGEKVFGRRYFRHKTKQAIREDRVEPYYLSAYGGTGWRC